MSFYEHVGNQDIDLDETLSNGDIESLIRLSESFFVSLFNDVSRSEQYTIKTWSVIRHFIESTLNRIKPSLLKDGSLSISDLHEKIERLKLLYEQLHRRFKPKSLPLRALSNDTVNEIFELIEPGSEQNPFRKSEQIRNYLLVSLMLLLGLRTSECLILTGANIGFEENRAWIKITTTEENEADRRSSPPALKTPYSHRIIPLPNYLYLVLNDYLSSNNRSKKRASDFIFLSNQGRAMSTRQARNILLTLREKLKNDQKGLYQKTLESRHSRPTI